MQASAHARCRVELATSKSIWVQQVCSVTTSIESEIDADMRSVQRRRA